MIAAVLAWVRRHFPNLKSGSYAVTSDWSEEYNCVAWAAGDTDKWWWPMDCPDVYWPGSLPYEVSVDNFDVFRQLGYEPCATQAIEEGFEKVGIYVAADGKPPHMARQVGGAWSSKLGSANDLVHEDLEGIRCSAYGDARYFLKREIGRPGSS